MKKLISFVCLIICSFVLLGFPKLVRLHKKKKLHPIFFDLKQDEKIIYSFKTYKKNFLYWKTTHDELLESFHESKKRREFYLAQIIDFLERMKKLVPDEKKELVTGYIDKYKKLSNKICVNNFLKSRREYGRKRLDVLRQKIIKSFSPYKKEIQGWFDKANA